MKPIFVWGIAIMVTAFHFWASRRKPKYWYLGGIIPVLWIGTVVFLFTNNMISLKDDWQMLLFPTIILLLIWICGHETAKKKEIDHMKAKDI